MGDFLLGNNFPRLRRIQGKEWNFNSLFFLVGHSRLFRFLEKLKRKADSDLSLTISFE